MSDSGGPTDPSSGKLAGSSGKLAGSSGKLAGSSGKLAGSSGKLAGSSGELAGSGGDLVRMLSPAGELLEGARPSMADDVLLRAHETMRLVRALDERMIRMQRQGRVGFHGSCTGEEAAVIGAAAALSAEDWIVPALRQGAAMLWRGHSLTAFIGQVLGNSGDPTRGRQMPSHQSEAAVHQVSWSSCIANQLLHAVGIARAMRTRGDSRIAVGFVGDGGTSEGDFHVAMNLAGHWRPPLVLICQNNQWAISVPLSSQTRVTRIADKARAYGLPGVRVDGNDLLAVHHVVAEARQRALSGGGPTLVEALTYRVGAHSTSDDPSRYRDESITERWRELDPIARVERYLVARGLRDEKAIDGVREEAQRRVADAVKEAEALPPVDARGLVEDVHAEVPAELARQWSEWGAGAATAADRDGA